MRRRHHDLRVWQQARELVASVYQLTASFPADERFGLTSQMRRAAVSVPSNIAEGAAREGSREFLRFLVIARGSLSELETQLILSRDLELVQQIDSVERQLEDLFASLGALINHTKSKE